MQGVLIAGYLQNNKYFENRDSSIVILAVCHGTVPRHPFNGIKNNSLGKTNDFGFLYSESNR
jgi:hypothetical protein